MRALRCLLALACFAAPAVSLGQTASPEQIEGSRLQCNAAGAAQSTCSLVPAGEAAVQATASPDAPDRVDRTLIIPLERTPDGLRPQIQADGQPFRMDCEPRVEGQVQRCRVKARAPRPAGQPI